MRILTFLSFCLFASALNAEVYKWKDANGNTVFGDSPPESAGARTVDLPMLTIADSYGSDKKDKKAANAPAVNKAEDNESDEAIPYKTFTVQSPKKDDAIRANNGNVMVRFELKPKLQAGHGIAVYLDGKQVANDSATVFSLKALDRGQHSLFAVLHDDKGDVLKNTEAVTFHVLRASVRN